MATRKRVSFRVFVRRRSTHVSPYTPMRHASGPASSLAKKNTRRVIRLNIGQIPLRRSDLFPASQDGFGRLSRFPHSDDTSLCGARLRTLRI